MMNCDFRNLNRSIDVSKTADGTTLSRLMKTPLGSAHQHDFNDTYSNMLMKQVYPRRKDVIGTPEHQQSIIYIDTQGDIPQYDGHHLAIYLDDYQGGYSASAQNDLICA